MNPARVSKCSVFSPRCSALFISSIVAFASARISLSLIFFMWTLSLLDLSKMSPTISSRMSSIVTKPETFPYSFTTIAIGTSFPSSSESRSSICFDLGMKGIGFARYLTVVSSLLFLTYFRMSSTSTIPTMLFSFPE